MEIVTSRFQNKGITNEEYIPIRISRGHPRFKTGFKVEHKITELMPDPEMFEMTLEDGKKALFEKWEKIGKEKIKELLFRIADGKRKIVCLCFEDVHAGEECHRRMFAEWWETQTGEIIPEI